MKKKIIYACITLLTLSLLMVLPCRAKATGTKLVAITFDDGPSKYTGELLDGLKARGAHATFFCVGQNAAVYQKTLARMLAEGHQIANHSNTHPDLATLSGSGIDSELSACANQLKKVTSGPFCLRPPYGSHNKTVRSHAGGPIILWSVDTLDWKYRNATTVYNNIMRDTKDGSIILLHDLYKSSVQGALQAIDALKEKGYEFVTVNELFRRRGITLQSGKVYSSAYNYGITLPAIGDIAAPNITVQNTAGGKLVTLTAGEGMAIYYTTDGSQPTVNSRKYTGSFVVSATTKITAAAYQQGYFGRTLQSTIWVEKAPMPTVQYTNRVITLAVSGTQAKMYYTTDGSTPSRQSTPYTAPIAAGVTTKVLVCEEGKGDREVCYTFTAYNDLFIDVPADKWYYNDVGEAVHRGLLVGTGENVFSSDTPMTRGMFVTVLARVAGVDVSGQTAKVFSDVDPNTWYSGAVTWAYNQSLVYGIGEGLFAPQAPITRQEMCAMLYRYIVKYNYEFPKNAPVAFVDQESISDWALSAVQAMQQYGMISGVGEGRFAPLQTATRAQGARLFVLLQNNMIAYPLSTN